MPTVKRVRGLKNGFAVQRFPLRAQDVTTLQRILNLTPTSALIEELEVTMGAAHSLNTFLDKLPNIANIRAGLKELFNKSAALNQLITDTDDLTRQEIRAVLKSHGYVVRAGDDPLDRASQALIDMFSALNIVSKSLKNVQSAGGTTKAAGAAKRRKSLQTELKVIFKKHLPAIEMNRIQEAIEAILPF